MVIANLLGLFIFLFLLWKTLKDDYHYEKVFNLGVTVFASSTLFYISSLFLDPQFSFWLILSGALIGFLFALRNQKMKFFESFEAFSIAILPWISLQFFVDSVKNSSLISFLSFWFTLICIFVYFFLKSQYRRFTWYKSGRVGFAGVVSLIVFFVSRLVLNYSNQLELIFSGSASLLLLILLYNLFKHKE